MQVMIGEEIWEVSDPTTDIQKAIEGIEGTLKRTKLFYSHMVVDGTEIYEPYEDYLLEHAENINRVEVVSRTYRELKDDTLATLKEYLVRARPRMERLAEMFYQGADETAWQEFGDLADALGWMAQVLPGIGSEQNAYSSRGQFLTIDEQVKEKVTLLFEAVEAGDTSQLADIIQYELLPLAEFLDQVVGETIDNEVVRDDLN